MCILCQAQSGLKSSGFGGAPTLARPHPEAGQGTATSVLTSGVRDVDALIAGMKWGTTALTFALPALASQYTAYDPLIDETSSFAPVTGDLAANVRAAIGHVALYTGLSIVETSNAGTANLLVGRTDQTGAGHAYLPDGSPFGGDVWLSASESYNAPVKGSHAAVTVLHEIGHALGLKHAHTHIGGDGPTEDESGIIAQSVSTARDSLEYTIMTYRSFVGQDLAANDFYTNEEYGFPQSLMMLDIAALQHMYGADFAANSGNTIYRFSATTGEMFVNNAGQGTPGANRLFLTVWDGGGTDTYDFSEYTNGVTVNLAPGAYSITSDDQRARLSDTVKASGNVYNALQFRDDARSLIENATGGSGADEIMGHAFANMLAGQGGDDILKGLGGSDTLLGGQGRDALVGDGTILVDSAASAIKRLYLATLNRAPDDGGWATWQAELAGGRALVDIASGFVGSAEFQATYGNNLSNTQFVTQIYNNVLKRAPDQAGLEANVNALASGVQSRTQLVVNFSESGEFKAETALDLHAGQIYRLYGATLARAPDAGGFESWTDARSGGRGLVDIAGGFVGSTEFQARYGALDNEGFVTLLYQNVLGRAPDAGGLASWKNQLDTNASTRTQVVTGFSESGEYINSTRAAADGFVRNTMIAWSDTLVGGAGDDRLTGGRGSDRFVFAASEGGNDTIYGFESFDTLELNGFSYANSAAALGAMSQQGTNVVLSYTGGSITFADTQLSVLQNLTAQGWVLG